jgi:hypothetical protein
MTVLPSAGIVCTTESAQRHLLKLYLGRGETATISLVRQNTSGSHMQSPAGCISRVLGVSVVSHFILPHLASRPLGAKGLNFLQMNEINMNSDMTK